MAMCFGRQVEERKMRRNAYMRFSRSIQSILTNELVDSMTQLCNTYMYYVMYAKAKLALQRFSKSWGNARIQMATCLHIKMYYVQYMFRRAAFLRPKLQSLFQKYLEAGEDWGESDIVMLSEATSTTQSRAQYRFMTKKEP